MNTNRAVFLNISVVQTKQAFFPGANHRVKFFFSFNGMFKNGLIKDSKGKSGHTGPTKLLETNHFLFLLQIPDLANKFQQDDVRRVP